MSRTVLFLIVLMEMGAILSPAHAIIRRHDVDDAQYVIQATQYPAVVDLLAPGDCIGTLIAPSWVLTAAHCAEHLSVGARLSIGDVNGVHLHPNYGNDQNDIALVQLTAPVTSISPTPVYRGRDELGKGVLFVGRGDSATGETGQAGVRSDGQTRRATNTVIGTDDDLISFVFNAPTDPEVTDLEGISGDGDSGGPAFIETSEGLHIAGVSSYQDENGNELGTYGVREYYARVSSYQGWIDGHLAGRAVTGSKDTTETGCTQARMDTPSSIIVLLSLLCALGLWRRRLEVDLGPQRGCCHASRITAPPRGSCSSTSSRTNG